MKPITIIGGGLAGLTLGILLRRENVPVAVVEAGKYPRHRVCGEFISGRGCGILQYLGVVEKLPHQNHASCCSFHMKDRKPVRMKLGSPALCVSRYDLDALLAEEFERAGGILKIGERANLAGDLESVVRATGRRRSENSDGHLFGLKAHTLGASLSSDLEMHFGDGLYVGLCPVGDGRVNVCGLFFSKRANPALHNEWRQTFVDSVCSDALLDARWDENSFSSVAGLTLDRHAPDSHFAVGDSAAMIPPLTGNGMSMAFESAELASKLVLAYCSGRASWSNSLVTYRAAWQKAFSARLRWAAFVQALIFHPVGQQFLHLSTRLVPRLPSLFFSKTR